MKSEKTNLLTRWVISQVMTSPLGLYARPEWSKSLSVHIENIATVNNI